MNILVYANCQINQLVFGLTLALAGKARVSGIDVNHPEHKAQLKNFLANNQVDYVIANIYPENVREVCSEDKIVEVPDIHFGGFHPDVAYFSAKSEPEKPLFFMNNPTISAIGLWAGINGVDKKVARSLYSTEVFAELGYLDYFDVAAHALRLNYKKQDINLAYIDKFLSSQDIFMHGPMHPKFEVTLSLCFGILEKLAIQPVNDFAAIKNAIVDPLQHEYSWGCFPPVANSLGIEGSWFIRHHDQLFVSIEHYLDQLYPFIAQNKQLQLFKRDHERFTNFHKIDDVLRSYL